MDVPDGRYYYLGRVQNSRTLHLLELDRSDKAVVPKIYLAYNTWMDSSDIRPWTVTPTPKKGQVWEKIVEGGALRCTVSHAADDVVVTSYPGQDKAGVLGVAYTVDNFLNKHEYVSEGE